MIRAPYNFVPLSDEVFFPEWAKSLSQDVPFSDGVNGTITLRIVAKSPVFVRNGHTKEDKEMSTSTYRSFSKTSDGKYFIPGTSIKGAVRSVLEIMSFGKMSQISRKRYGVRDLKLDGYLSKFQYEKIHCGWMSKKNNQIEISDNGLPYRISHKEIDAKFGTSFCREFSATCFGPHSDHSSLYKYGKLRDEDINQSYSFVVAKLNPENQTDPRMEAKFPEKGKTGDITGKIVFTGQSTGRKEKTDYQKAMGKFYEFVFLELKEPISFQLDTEDSRYKDFCFIYKDSKEWKYWEREMNSGKKVPVFFYVDNEEIHHLGLSYLYKIPYPRTIDSYLPSQHNNPDMDLCECLFGKVGRNRKDEISLKGRVQFSHAFSEEVIPYPRELVPYMSSPKPTYYPIYMQQKGIDGSMVTQKGELLRYSTMFISDALLRGWKRYPIRRGYSDSFMETFENQENNTSPFIPLGEGSSFKCKIRFFNLKPEELGALLYTLDLHQGYFHSIGFAKPFGFGQVRFTVEDLYGDVSLDNKDELKEKFIMLMSNKIPSYTKSVQIKELSAMLQEQQLRTSLEYMNLDEFVDCKKQNAGKDQFGEYLQNYTKYIKPVVVEAHNLIDEAVVSLWDRRIKNAKLIKGKDLNPKILDLGANTVKLKVGDRIKVKKIMKGSNVVKLIYLKKI